MSKRPPKAPRGLTANGMPGIVRRGLMLVLSSPSGAGKSTISRALLEGDAGLTMSVSVTTRSPRPGEIEGSHYRFVDRASFERMVADGELLEHANVFDHGYGTPREPVEAALSQGHDVLFDVDWQGTQQLRQAARADLVSVFILPPSREELERRLRARGQDSEEVVLRRMATAADEMSHWAEYDYVVVNRSINQAVVKVAAILAAERLRRDRQIGLDRFVAAISQS